MRFVSNLLRELLVLLTELVDPACRVDELRLAILTSGYSLPSSQVMVSFVAAAERLRKAYSFDMSLKTTSR
jgi:hypothetical protein